MCADVSEVQTQPEYSECHYKPFLLFIAVMISKCHVLSYSRIVTLRKLEISCMASKILKRISFKNISVVFTVIGFHFVDKMAATKKGRNNERLSNSRWQNVLPFFILTSSISDWS
jgi:hypothetical protein